MHICGYGRVDISIIHACFLIVAIYIRAILLHCNIQGLQGNKFNSNKSLNYATLNHAVHYVTLQSIGLTISENYSTSSDQDQILPRMYL